MSIFSVVASKLCPRNIEIMGPFQPLGPVSGTRPVDLHVSGSLGFPGSPPSMVLELFKTPCHRPYVVEGATIPAGLDTILKPQLVENRVWTHCPLQVLEVGITW